MSENLKTAENLQATIYSLLDERSYEDTERILKEQLHLLDAMPEKNHYPYRSGQQPNQFGQRIRIFREA
ncbi:hypothetical protein [Mucilaginibacter sp.]|uniref:hypothetical protein n=1 Tax=Mucilaginibacter sp. TaxID=1882438 RepID=UPI00260E6BD5|nr:hypothetical protein [Mucilaginibacter sp.]MDB5029331.1 hypothetical protein [Mucilaginibacter sp.]